MVAVDPRLLPSTTTSRFESQLLLAHLARCLNDVVAPSPDGKWPEEQRATMRDGLDDAQQGREQASRRAARISADLAATELQASAELRMFERRAE